MPDPGGRTAVAFLHGGVHTARCWDETITAVSALDAELDVAAPNLPGRGGVDGNLAGLTVDDCARSVSDQISSLLAPTTDRRIVLVGHSLAGLILPKVIAELGAELVAQVIFVACCLPPEGQTVLDTLPFGLHRIAHRLVRQSPVIQMPEIVLRRFFGNGATSSQIDAIRRQACPESSALLTEPAGAPIPRSIPRAWILPLRDRALRPASQRGFMTALGGVDVVISLDAGHEVMITHPRELAEAIVGIVRREP